jgi:hypothetical protein
MQAIHASMYAMMTIAYFVAAFLLLSAIEKAFKE